MEQLYGYWWIVVLLVIVFSGLVTVNQGYINVITMFGKYRRVLRPGLNFKIPILEQVAKRISIQNIGGTGIPGGYCRPGERIF